MFVLGVQGFKALRCARIILAGIEVMHMSNPTPWPGQAFAKKPVRPELVEVPTPSVAPASFGKLRTIGNTGSARTVLFLVSKKGQLDCPKAQASS